MIAEMQDGQQSEVIKVQDAYDKMGRGATFNRIMKGINILSSNNGKLTAEFTVTEEHVNDKGTIYGGLLAALVDVLTATCVKLLLPESRIVSIELSVSYLSAAKIGEIVFIEANCVKAGKSIAFTNSSFRRRSDNSLIITAKQQLAILSDKTKQEKPKINGIIEEKKKDLKIIWPSLAIGDGIYLDKMKEIFANMSGKNNFYKNFKNINVLCAEPPFLVISIILGEEHLNNGGTMHGGFTASIADLVTSRAVQMTETCPRVSVDLSVSYLLPAKIGEEIIIEGKCLKIGWMMAFTEATFIKKCDGSIVAKGRHNMYFLRNLKKESEK
uniref:Acyl-coenzyme A thioesterase 13 n=1 Tax=Meloidogyne hapla TaxID=6305 RepID=A0A1I8B8S6_MELHA